MSINTDVPSTDRFETFFHNAPSGMALISVDGRWTEVNRALCETLGYPQEDLIGDSIETFIHPGDYTGGELRGRLLAGEIAAARADWRFVRRDGAVVWMRVALSLVRDAAGTPSFLIAQCEDVTAAKAVEQELERERLWLDESQAAGRIGSWELDLETGEMRWSREQFDIYGVDPAGGVPGLDEMLALIHHEDRGAMLETVRTHVASGEDFIDEYRVVHPRLGIRALLVRGCYLPRDLALGRPARMVGTTLDVTAERRAEAERRRDEERLRLLATIVEQSVDAIVVFDPAGVITHWNDGATRMYGYSAEEAIGRTGRFLLAAGHEAEDDDLLAAALRGEGVRAMQTARRRRDGDLVQVALTVAPILSSEGQPLGVSVIARDITEQLRAQERLLDNERQLYDAQALAHVGSWEWDVALPRPDWTAEMARIYGYDSDHVPEVDDLVARVHPEDRERIWELLEEARSGYPGEAEYRIVRPDGEIRFVHGRLRTRADDDGVVTHIYAAVQDITERKLGEAELERLATHDPLTGLPNRRTFEGRLELELARARREGTGLSLAVLDIDRFKRINDTLGHQAGDEVLRVAAAELQRQVRSHELIARVGGEEFAWILPGADETGAMIALERGRRAVAGLMLEELGRVTLSAGFATLRDDLDAESLYRLADMALLDAKAGGRDRVVAAGAVGATGFDGAAAGGGAAAGVGRTAGMGRPAGLEPVR